MHVTKVEVGFIAEDPARTRVELGRRGFEHHGGGADAVQGFVDSSQGWAYCLELFEKEPAA